MAKGKPSRAFLEALKQDKKRRGDDKPGGGFATPEWFFNNQNPSSAAPPSRGLTIPTTQKPKPWYQLRAWQIGIPAFILVAGLVAVGVYTFGHGRATPRNSVSTDTLREGPAQGSAMDVSSASPKLPAPPLIPAAANNPAPPANPNPTPTPAAPETTESGQRVIGMNYVVFFNAVKDDSTAEEAAAALRRAGIGCTLERNHPYAPKCIIVVGTTPFAKANTPEYQQYIKKAMLVSDKFSAGSRWKKFEPAPYKWR